MDLSQPCFRALSDPTRRAILVMLRKEDLTIAQIADHFDMTRAAVKKHLTVLEDGGLITTRSQGRTRMNALNPTALRPAIDWFAYFDGFWDTHLSALHATIQKDLTNDDTSN